MNHQELKRALVSIAESLESIKFSVLTERTPLTPYSMAGLYVAQNRIYSVINEIEKGENNETKTNR